MTQPAEAALLAVAVAGDAEAFRGLLRGALGDVYGFCASQTLDVAEAEGATGAAFRAAAEGLASIPAGVTFRGWVFQQAWRELVGDDGDRGLAPLRELRERYGFEAADLAAILGVSVASGETLARRLGDHRVVANDGPLAPGLDVRVEREAFRGWPPRPVPRLAIAASATSAVAVGRRRWLAIGGPLLAALAGLLAVLLIAPRSPIGLTGNDDGNSRVGALATATMTPSATPAGSTQPSPTRTATRTVTATKATGGTASATATRSLTANASASATATVSATGTASPTGTATPAATSTPTVTQTATPTQTATATPCTALLSVSAREVTVILDTPAFLVVRTSCGTASIGVGSSEGWLSASATDGSVSFPGSVQVTLLATSPAVGGEVATVMIQGPNNSISVTVTVVAP